MVILFALVSAWFIFYFFAIGASAIGLLPLLVFMLFVYNMSSGKHTTGTLRHFFSSQSLLIAWALMLLGMYGILSFGGVPDTRIGLMLVGINIIGWFGSILSNYAEGKNIFHIGYYMALGIFVRNIITVASLPVLGAVLLMLPLFTFGIYSFIVFVLRLRAPIEKERESMAFLLFHLSIISALIQLFFHNIFVGLILGQLYLLLVYRGISVLQAYGRQEPDLPSADVYDILAGKKILQRTKPAKMETLLYLSSFIADISEGVKTTLSALNILLILAIMYCFFTFATPNNLPLEILYRISIWLFFVNFLFLKKINFHYQLQRYSVFFIVNFAVYLGIAQGSGYENLSMSLLGIAWNMLASGIIFYSEFAIKKNLLQKEDYTYRISANVMSMGINIYLLVILGLPVGLTLPIIFFYLGIEGFLVMQTIKFVKRTYPPTITVEQILRNMG